MKAEDLLVITEVYKGRTVVIQIDKGGVGGGMKGLVWEIMLKMEAARMGIDDLVEEVKI